MKAISSGMLAVFFVLSAIATESFAKSNTGCAHTYCRPNKKEYNLILPAPLPEGTFVSRPALRGRCQINVDRDVISYRRANASFKGVDSCWIQFNRDGAECEEEVYIDLSQQCPQLKFSGSQTCR
ncbi:MAG: hypothetical protein V4654_15540 [Bdellovibrionota bacterium]